MHEADLSPLVDAWMARWLAGGPAPTFDGAPSAWSAALRADDELAMLALAMQWRQYMLDAALPVDARPATPLPPPALALLPDPLRLRFRRFARAAAPAVIAPVLRAIAASGYMAHPYDWRPQPDQPGLPAAYGPWRAWVSAQARGDAAASAVDDDLAVLPTADRRRVYAELRARDPAGARATLAALLPRLGADARLTLVEQLAQRLSDDDLPLLRELAGDRSEKVQLAAVRLRARLGDVDPLDDAARAQLREWFDLGHSGMLRRRLRLALKPLKTQVQRTARRERLAATGWGALAATFDLDELALLEAWAPGDEDDPALLDSLAQTATQPVVARALERLVTGDLVFARHAPIWVARDLMLQRVGVAGRERLVRHALVERTMFDHYDELSALVDAPLAGIDLAAVRRSPQWQAVDAALRQYVADGTPGLLGTEIAALASLLPPAAAGTLLEYVVNAGMRPADPLLDPLFLVANCPAPSAQPGTPS